MCPSVPVDPIVWTKISEESSRLLSDVGPRVLSGGLSVGFRVGQLIIDCTIGCSPDTLSLRRSPILNELILRIPFSRDRLVCEMCHAK